MTSARRFKLKLTAPKPRNPLVAAAALRQAGSHRKSSSALRQAEKAALKVSLKKPPTDG